MQFKKKAIDFPPTAADWAVKEMLVNTIQRKREKQILGIIITLLLYLLLIFFILILGYYLNKKHEFSAPQGPPSSPPQGPPSSAPQGPPSSAPQGPPSSAPQDPREPTGRTSSPGTGSIYFHVFFFLVNFFSSESVINVGDVEPAVTRSRKNNENQPNQPEGSRSKLRRKTKRQ